MGWPPAMAHSESCRQAGGSNVVIERLLTCGYALPTLRTSPVQIWGLACPCDVRRMTRRSWDECVTLSSDGSAGPAGNGDGPLLEQGAVWSEPESLHGGRAQCRAYVPKW